MTTTAMIKSLLLAVLVAFAWPAGAAYWSQVTVFSALPSFPDHTNGGINELSAEAWGSALEDFGNYQQTYTVYGAASAESGMMISVPVAGGSNAAPGSRRTGSGSANLRVQDVYAIAAGSSGLDDGDPVNIRVQAALRGVVQLEGAPSGLSIATFRVNAGGLLVDYSSGSLNPPQEFDVDRYWDHEVVADVGSNLLLDVLLNTDVGGTSLQPGESATNFVVYDAEFRVSPGEGYEDIELVSQAGAPTRETLIEPGDADSDAVPNSVDNCVLHANADQRDSNADGIGNACDADLNGDCIVNVVDLGMFKGVFFTADAHADFNGDGVVNAIDLGTMKGMFFARPGPSSQPHACNPAIIVAGTLTMSSTALSGLDIDSGTVGAGAPAGSDLAFADAYGVASFLVPVDTAQRAVHGSVEPSYAECAAAPFTSVLVSMWSLDTDVYLCVYTDEGRIGWARVVSAADPPLGTATTIDVQFQTWAR